MDWFREVNHYCEWANASYWTEPLDALGNVNFLAAAAIPFVAYAAVMSRAAEALAGSLNGSARYIPAPVLIAGCALAPRRRAPDAARVLAIERSEYSPSR